MLSRFFVHAIHARAVCSQAAATPSPEVIIKRLKKCCDRGDVAAAETYFSELSGDGLNSDILDSMVGLYCRSNNLTAAEFMRDRFSPTAPPSLSTFNHLISLYGQNKQISKAKACYQEAVSLGLKPNTETYSNLILAHSNCQDTEGAASVCARIQDVAMHNSVLQSLVARNKLKVVDAVVEWMRTNGVDFSESTFNSLVVYFANSRQLDRALELYEEMKRANVAADTITFRSLINGSAKSKQLDRALMLFEEMKHANVAADSITYDSLITCCAHNQQLDRAFGLFEEMKHLHLIPDTTTYSRLITFCAISKQLDRALSLFEEMKQANVAADSMTYNILITCCANSQQLDRALELYEEMKQARVAAANTVTDSGITGLDRSLLLFEKMKHVNTPDEVTYNRLITCCVNNKQLDRALELFEEMNRANIAGDSVTYNRLITCCANSAQLDRALEIFEEMKLANLAADAMTYNSLITCCANNTSFDRALELLDEMKLASLPTDSIPYNRLITCFAKSKQIDRALELFEEMKRANVPTDSATYSSLISCCANSKQLDRALELFEEMKHANVVTNPITIGALISACCKCGRPELALSYLTSLVLTDDANFSPRAVLRMFNDIMLGYALLGDLDMVLDVEAELRSRKLTPDAFTAKALEIGRAKGRSTRKDRRVLPGCKPLSFDFLFGGSSNKPGHSVGPSLPKPRTAV